MRREKQILGAILLLLSTGMFPSCVSVAAYQKMHLNDKEMELNVRKVEHFEISAESYREGAAGINGGKVGGGCGCN